VELRDSTGATLKGTWRISTLAGGIVNKTVTLVPNGTETIAVLVGDKWQGVYRFDHTVTLAGTTLAATDPIRVGGPLLRSDPAALLAHVQPDTSLAIRGLSLCNETGSAIKPGSAFTVCADVKGTAEIDEMTISVEGAFEALAIGYENCRQTIAVPASTRPGRATVTLTARDLEGHTARLSKEIVVVADVQAPTIVNVFPSDGAAVASGGRLRIGVEAWDDVAVSAVSIDVDGARTVLTKPPFEIESWTAPASAGRALPVEIAVTDPSGNVIRKTLTVNVGSGRSPFTGASSGRDQASVSSEDGALFIDGGWPYRDTPENGKAVELPAIGTGSVVSVDGSRIARETAADPRVVGAFLDLIRGGQRIGRFRIEGVEAGGYVLKLESSAARLVAPGDSFEGVWVFDELSLVRGARLTAADRVEATRLTVDSSSTLVSKNAAVPPFGNDLSECRAPKEGTR
jgi:hypothetical protein